EAAMNVACVGARPMAVVNCLNFGNPEHPEVMWELSEAVDGMGEACRAFDAPVVGGNVSLYNESAGSDIDPTPVVGLLGLVDRLDTPPPGVRLEDGGRLLLFGETDPVLGGSAWARDRGHPGAGPLPDLDLRSVSATAALVRGLVGDGLVQGVHDVAEGGVGAALAEMAVASGVGLTAARVPDHRFLFSESAGRAVACVHADDLTAVEGRAADAGVPVARIGVAGGDRVSVKGLLDLDLHELTATWRDRLPSALGASAAAP
ncbi:MAG: AIR synthase related protein, partial [Actinomycetota bacterium]